MCPHPLTKLSRQGDLAVKPTGYFRTSPHSLPLSTLLTASCIWNTLFGARTSHSPCSLFLCLFLTFCCEPHLSSVIMCWSSSGLRPRPLLFSLGSAWAISSMHVASVTIFMHMTPTSLSSAQNSIQSFRHTSERLPALLDILETSSVPQFLTFSCYFLSPRRVHLLVLCISVNSPLPAQLLKEKPGVAEP